MKFHHIGRAALVFLAAALLAIRPTHAQTVVSSFSDIQYWVGSGSNQAAMVIDWVDGTTPSSFAWGFRWNGTATGEDMIKAIAGYVGSYDGLSTIPATANGIGDPNLTLYIDTEFSFGDAVYQLNYNSGATSHTAGGFDAGSGGFWGYYTADSTSTLPASWTFSMVGMGDRTLSNNSWDAWTWGAAPDFNALPPSTPVAAAVPEPATFALLILGGGGLVLFYRRRHA